MQKLNIIESKWDQSAPIELFLTNGEPISIIKDVVMKRTPGIRSNNDGYETENVTYE